MTEHFKTNWLSSSAGVECACGEDHAFDHESEPVVCKCGRVFTLYAKVSCTHDSRHIRVKRNDEYMGDDKLWPDGSIGPETQKE